MNASANTSQRPALSVVVTCFNEQENIAPFHAQLVAALRETDRSAEIVYVNDGSVDGTLKELVTAFEGEPLVSHVIDLARNAGQTHAQTAGIAVAAGQDFVFMDCDLQLDPHDLHRLLERFDQGFDMVGGYREVRRDPGLRVWFSKFGNAVVSRILGKRIRDLGCTFKIINGDLVRAFNLGPFRPMDPGEIILSLRDVDEVPVSHKPRVSGRSRWTLGRMVSLYYNVFSNLAPVVFPFLVGIIVLVLTLFLAYLCGSAFFPEWLPWTTSPRLTQALVGLNMLLNLVFFLFIGEFSLIGRRSSNAPAYIVRNVWQRAD